MSDNVDRITRAAGLQQSAARLSDVLGDSTGDSSLSRFLTRASVGAPQDVGDGLGTVVGMAVGGYIGHKKARKNLHVVDTLLGVVGGASAGRNLPALLDPALRKTALVNMGQTATAIALSASSPKHPIAAFVIGEIVAGAAIYFWRLR